MYAPLKRVTKNAQYESYIFKADHFFLQSKNAAKDAYELGSWLKIWKQDEDEHKTIDRTGRIFIGIGRRVVKYAF